MRSTRIPAQEQYRLIMECRQSGLTDHQWCVEHDIKPGTFYNWVKRLREKGCTDLPPASGRRFQSVPKQEVVKVAFNTFDSFNGSELIAKGDSDNLVSIQDVPTVMLTLDKCTLSIPNGTDPCLLAQLLRSLKEFEC